MSVPYKPGRRNEPASAAEATGVPLLHVSTNHRPRTATQWPVTIKIHACSKSQSVLSRSQVARVGELRLRSVTLAALAICGDHRPFALYPVVLIAATCSAKADDIAHAATETNSDFSSADAC